MTRCCLYLLFVLSGIAGLGYEIVWTRSFAVGLGHEVPSMLAVVAAYFGGFAIGAWCLDRRVSTSRDPGAWYSGLEIVIAVWSVASVLLIPWANGHVAWLTGPEPSALRHWLAAFLAPLVILLPATFAMGATLPAMDRLFSRMQIGRHSVGGLYGANTFGAVVGTLATTFWLIPTLGHRTTLLILASMNATCAVGVYLVRGLRFRAVGATETPEVSAGVSRVRIAATALAAGCLGIGFEVLCVTVMGQSFENTVYSFASALSVYLVGTAVGATLYQFFGLWRWPRTVLTWLVVGIGIACLLSVPVLSGASSIYAAAREWFGGGMGGSIAAEIAVAMLVFGPPTIGMGALFSHLAQLYRADRSGVGHALAWNTLGACLAPAVFAVVLLPLLGAKWTLILIGVTYFALVAELSAEVLQTLAATGMGLLVLLIFLPSDLVHVTSPPGSELLEVRQGLHGTAVAVLEPDHHKTLTLNNRFSMGGTRSEFGEQRQAHLPLLLHPNPRQALFLGVGTGITFYAAAEHPGLEAVGVELAPEVVELVPHFNVQERPDRLRIVTADARRYVRACRDKYDVIVADLFHPARDGAGSLYTVEHFRAIRGRLVPGGVFCQWIPSYQMDRRTLRMIMRSFSQVFGEWRMYVAHFNVETPCIGLITGGLRPDTDIANWRDPPTDDRNLASALQRAGISSELDVWGCAIGEARDFAAYVGGGPLNVDDRPEVTYMAPAFVYGPPQPSYRNLEELLQVSREADGESNSRDPLTLYRGARDLYLLAEISWRNGEHDEAIEQWLESARTSPDFDAAYAMLMLRASEQVREDVDEAVRILGELVEANPERDEASKLLQQLQRGRR